MQRRVGWRGRAESQGGLWDGDGGLGREGVRGKVGGVKRAR